VAQIGQFTPFTKVRQRVHDKVECRYSVFTGLDGQKYLQLDTIGTPTREVVGVTSQTIQFGKQAAADLKRLIEQAFPGLR